MFKPGWRALPMCSNRPLPLRSGRGGIDDPWVAGVSRLSFPTGCGPERGGMASGNGGAGLLGGCWGGFGVPFLWTDFGLESGAGSISG